MKFPVWCQHVFCSCLGWSSFLAFINTCAWPLCRLWGLRLIRRFMMSLCRPLHFPNRFGRFQSVIVTIVRSVISSALIMANHVASQHDFDRPSLQSSLEFPSSSDLSNSVMDYSLVEDHFLGIHRWILPGWEFRLSPRGPPTPSSSAPHWCINSGKVFFLQKIALSRIHRWI